MNPPTKTVSSDGSGAGGASVAQEGIEYGKEGKVWLPEEYPHHFSARRSEADEVTALATAVCAKGWSLSVIEPRAGVLGSNRGLDLQAHAVFDDSAGVQGVLREALLLMQTRYGQLLSGSVDQFTVFPPHIVLVDGLDEFFEELNTRKNPAYSCAEARQVRRDWDYIARKGGALRGSVHILATGCSKNLLSSTVYSDFDREEWFWMSIDGL